MGADAYRLACKERKSRSSAYASVQSREVQLARPAPYGRARQARPAGSFRIRRDRVSTIRALGKTYKQLRDSDFLLKLSKALPNAQDEDPPDQVQAAVAVHARGVSWKSVDSI